MSTNVFRISPAVSAAIESEQPVVALESTVIAHGLPRPQNFETALQLERTINSSGALPATIAILNGQLSVGIDHSELRTLAEQDGIQKISTRDIAIAVARHWNGATTVASTSWIASRAGIKVFATGGIGGVHRGSLPDISADLPELARTPIVVVCSGAKIVLDLPATREWLETHAVTVVGFDCDEMPAFYSRSSGLPVDVRVKSAGEVADIYRAQRNLSLASALLVCVPVPEQFEVPRAVLQASLDEALDQAAQLEIGGRDLTPFLLTQMAQKSGGATLRANIALLENNAAVAAKIAIALES